MPALIAEAVIYVTGSTAAVAATATTAAVAATGVATVAFAGITYATLIGYAVTIGASIAYSSAQNAKARNALRGLDDGGRGTMARDPLAYQRKIYGEVPTAGPIIMMHTTGTKNEFLHIVMAIASHECDSLGKVYFENSEGLEEVPLDGTGTNGGGGAVGKYAGFFICNKYLGTPTQAADALFMAAAAGVWTANHKLSGHAYVYMQFKFSTDLYSNGMPVVRVLTKGAKVLDPRVGIVTKTCDVTAGVAHIGCATGGLAVGNLVVGSGILPGTRIVSIDVSTTFFTVNVAPKITNSAASLGFGVDAWSANAALCIGDYLSDYKFGKGVPWSRINTTGLSAEANTSDETVVTDTGTEPRFTINGAVTSEQDAMPGLLTACAGRIIDTGGSYSLVVGTYRSPTLTFTDDDLAGAFSTTPRQSMRESFSGVRGTYISPINDWQASDFPVVKNDTYTAQDGGRRRWKDVAYPFTISPATAQRLAKMDLERGRQQTIIQGVFKLKAMQVQCCDTIRLTRASLGWVNKEFEVTEWSLKILNGSSMVVAITAQETASAVYDWANGEETTVDLAPNSSLPDPSKVPTPSGLTLLTDSSTSWSQTDGTFVPRLKVSWNTPNNTYVEQGGFTVVEYKKNADAIWLVWSRLRGDVLLDYITDVKVGTGYDVRVHHINAVGVRSNNNGLAVSPDYASQLNYVIANDNAAPATPSGLAFVTGTGKSVSLSWNVNTEVDLDGYIIQRSPDNATWAQIARVSANRFVDVNVTIGNPFYYRIAAIDLSANQSTFTASVGPATPGTIGAGSVDSTPPSDPAAPTLSSSGTRVSGDGTVLSFFVVNMPALPAGAVGLNLFARKSGAADWMLYDQKTAGGGTANIDDLTPGTVYDIAVEAFTVFGYTSNKVTLASQTAPNRSTGPSTPSGTSLTAPSAGNGVPPVMWGALTTFATIVRWTNPADLDLDHIEIKSTATDSDGAVDYEWCASLLGFGSVTATLAAMPSAPMSVVLYSDTPSNPGYVRIRAVNRSGLQSAWVRVGQANLSAAVSGGNAISKTVGTTAGLLPLAQDVALAANNLSDLANKTTARNNLSVRSLSVTYNAAGGAATEGFTVNHAFGVLQNNVQAAVVDPPLFNDVVHDFSNGANDANNTRLQLVGRNGGNVAAGLQRVTIHFL